MISTEVRNKIKDFNRKYEQAEKDGYYVVEDNVYESKPKPGEFAKFVCKVWDYEG